MNLHRRLFEPSAAVVLLATLLFALTPTARGATLIHVDDDAPPGGDGSSWATAFNDLQVAMAAADAINGSQTVEIRVAQGFYRPAPPGGNRAATFHLLNNTALRGAYAGIAAPDPDEHDVAAFETILSGDLNGDDTPVACTLNSQCFTIGGLCTNDGFCIIAANYAENSYHVVTGSGTNTTAALNGVTIMAGSATGGDANSRGGGMYSSGGGSSRVTDCKFIGNRGHRGGGMYIVGSSSKPTLTHCMFHGNYAVEGGGMYNTGNSRPTLTHCSFAGNSASSGGAIANGGGGVPNYGSSPIFIDCTFSENSASRGGGMYSGDDSSPTLTQCLFNENSAYNGGGGMYNSGGIPKVTNCAFRRNTGNYFGGGMSNVFSSPIVMYSAFEGNSTVDGGGMHNWGGSPTVTHCTFYGNSAAAGGGMYNNSTPSVTNSVFSGNFALNNGGGIYNVISSPTVINSTFNRNSAVFQGGAIYNATGSPTVTNCISWGNVPTQFHNVAGTTVVNYSIVQGGWSGAGGTGNSAADPFFVDSDGPDNLIGSIDDNLRLRLDSPAINKGDPGMLYVPDVHELDGHARVLCGRVDMGAYEYGIGDFDCRRGVNLFDFASWEECFTGPVGEPFGDGCEAFDFDSDADVDWADFGRMQIVLGATSEPGA